MPALDYCIHDVKLTAATRYGFKASFNPIYPTACGDPRWVSPWHFGLSEVPTVLMVKSYRTGIVWQLMPGCAYIAGGLRWAGFTGGWL